MSRSLRVEGLGRICAPVIETTVERALKTIREANRLADLIELRIDYLRKPDLLALLKEGEKPVIVTNRRKEEGGRYQGDERMRVEILREAIELEAEYVDVEIGTERSVLKDLMADKKETEFILSFHDFRKTPSERELRRLYERMTRLGPGIIKMVTFAKSWQDNLKVLTLIPYAKGRKQKIVAFCMGEKGKISRVFAPMMGAAWTYASLNKKRVSAPGQLTIQEMRDIWKRLR